MHKYACYCATRNIYHKLGPSLKSLLHNSDVTTVFILCEDDVIPEYADWDGVNFVNVSRQKWFDLKGPNYGCMWTWMVMMRAALSKVLPHVDRILSLDCDTIVTGDISRLWEMNLDGYCFAAAREPEKSTDGFVYHNCGVVMFNLEEMRKGKADEVIESLNTRRYTFCEQDCLNELCQGQILEIDSIFNYSLFTEQNLFERPRIIHFAAVRGWYEKEPLVRAWDLVRYEDI